MNRILASCCLMFIPFHFVSAEDSIVSSHTEFEANQEQLLGQNAIESLRTLTKFNYKKTFVNYVFSNQYGININ